LQLLDFAGEWDMKKILICGADGMLGHRIFRHFEQVPDCKAIGTVRSEEHALPELLLPFKDKFVYRMEAEIFSSFKALIEIEKPDYIINCIGILKQRPDQASNYSLMIKTNALFPHQLEVEAEKIGAKLVTFSSDCIFLGDIARPYTESDHPDALSLYGKTKALGECVGRRSLTLRTSFIGFEVKNFTSLLAWFLSVAKKQQTEVVDIKGYTRAIWSGVTTRYIAEWLEQMIREFPNLEGVFNLSGETVNKFELLGMIAQKFKMEVFVQRDDTFIADKVCSRAMSSDRLELATKVKIPRMFELLSDLAKDKPFYESVL
jgi:dTDP-4-dehydrorhamnose reductase